MQKNLLVLQASRGYLPELLFGDLESAASSSSWSLLGMVGTTDALTGHACLLGALWTSECRKLPQENANACPVRVPVAWLRLRRTTDLTPFSYCQSPFPRLPTLPQAAHDAHISPHCSCCLRVPSPYSPQGPQHPKPQLHLKSILHS